MKGSPPGYVGYGQGGVLTRSRSRTPLQRGAASTKWKRRTAT
ncbi:MAG: hypothetical protein ACLR31_21425 [Escherichia coli]